MRSVSFLSREGTPIDTHTWGVGEAKALCDLLSLLFLGLFFFDVESLHKLLLEMKRWGTRMEDL